MTCYPHIENGVVLGVYYSPQPGKAETAYTDDDHRIIAHLNPVTTIEDIKAEANRRISEILPRWMVDRAVSGGGPIPQSICDAAQAIRDRSNELEQSLPDNYTDDAHWG